MCHFEVILEKVTYMVILYIIYILYKYKDKISIFGQLKTGLMLFVTCYLLLSKVLFTNLKSYGPQSHREDDKEQRTGAGGGIVAGRGVCIKLTISDLQA